MGSLCCIDNRKEGIEMYVGEEDPHQEYIDHMKEQEQPHIHLGPVDPLNTYIFGCTVDDIDYEDPDLEDQYKNKYEKNISLTKKSLIEFYEKITNMDPSTGKWDTKVNEPTFKQYIKLKGTELTTEQAVMISEITFDQGTNIPKLMRAIHNPHLRQSWDKDIMKTEIITVVNDKLVLWHQLNKSAIKIVQQRDFLEKKVKFTHNGAQYIYFSSIPDEHRPPSKDISRAYSICGFQVFKKLEDGRIQFTSVNQNDFNIPKLMTAVALNQIPKTVMNWITMLSAHLKQIEEEANYEVFDFCNADNKTRATEKQQSSNIE